MRLLLALTFALSLSSAAALAVEPSPYAGQKDREIKSLSPEDIKTLRNGGGWGLAKAAELNGVPGPAHLLELKKEIPLTEEQGAELTTLFRQMQAEAIKAGKRFIHLEATLERHFRLGTINDTLLQSLLGQIAESQADLRYVHLKYHLKTPKLLTAHQIKRYNQLRGYDQPGHQAVQHKGHSGHKH